jgi:protein disulfide-isomerase A1
MKFGMDLVKSFKKQPLMMQIVAVIVVALLVWFGVQFFQKNVKESFGDNECLVTYFHMDGCPHCKNFDPEWAKFEDHCNGIDNCKTKKVEAKSGDPSIQAYNVQGYPTVTCSKGGKKVDTYDGERTKDGLVSWIKKHV